MIRIQRNPQNSSQCQVLTSPPIQESFVEKMILKRVTGNHQKIQSTTIQFEDYFKSELPTTLPKLRQKTSSLSKSLSKLVLLPSANDVNNVFENSSNLDFQKSQFLRNRKGSGSGATYSSSYPSPGTIPRSSSTNSMSSIGSNPKTRSITPIASPVNHQDLALCADLDIDPLTLENEGALKRGIDLRGIALCEYQGVHLRELKQYNAVRVDVDITGISICKANGIGVELLFNMGVIEPKIDISGIAICKTQGIDIFDLQDYGLIGPSRSLRTVAMLNQQGYKLEEISNMEFHIFDSTH